MPTVTQVFLDPKKNTQAYMTWDRGNGAITVTIVEWWKVVFDSPQSDPTECFGAIVSTGGTGLVVGTLPIIGTLYAGHINAISDTWGGLALCTDVRPQHSSDSPQVYDVQVTYSSFPVPPITETGTKWNIEISGDSEEISETVYSDTSGKAIVNTAGQNFDPTLPEVFCEREYTISFNSYAIDVANIDVCLNKINAAPINLSVNGYVKTFEAQSLRLIKAPFSTSVTVAPPQPSGGGGTPTLPIPPFKIQYILRYRPPITGNGGALISGWINRVVDQGLYQIDSGGISGYSGFSGGSGFSGSSGYSGTGKLIPCSDRDKHPVTSPVYLDGSGHQSARGANPTYLEIPTVYVADFTGLLTGLSA